MSARKTALHFSAYSLDGTDLLAVLTSAQMSIDGVLVQGEGLAETFAKKIWAGGKGTATFEIEHTASSVPSTMLNASVYTIGGASQLANVESGTIKIAIPVSEGKGGNDKWSYPNVSGARQFSASAALKVPYATVLLDLMTKAASDTVADHYVDLSMTIGSDTITCSTAIQNASHGASRGELQMLNVSLEGADDISSAGSGIYATAFTGDALVSLLWDTEAGQYGTSGSPLVGVITSMEISFALDQITKVTGTIEIQGSPKPTTSS